MNMCGNNIWKMSRKIYEVKKMVPSIGVILLRNFSYFLNINSFWQLLYISNSLFIKETYLKFEDRNVIFFSFISFHIIQMFNKKKSKSTKSWKPFPDDGTTFVKMECNFLGLWANFIFTFFMNANKKINFSS